MSPHRVLHSLDATFGSRASRRAQRSHRWLDSGTRIIGATNIGCRAEQATGAPGRVLHGMQQPAEMEWASPTAIETACGIWSRARAAADGVASSCCTKAGNAPFP